MSIQPHKLEIYDHALTNGGQVIRDIATFSIPIETKVPNGGSTPVVDLCLLSGGNVFIDGKSIGIRLPTCKTNVVIRDPQGRFVSYKKFLGRNDVSVTFDTYVDGVPNFPARIH